MRVFSLFSGCLIAFPKGSLKTMLNETQTTLIP